MRRSRSKSWLSFHAFVGACLLGAASVSADEPVRLSKHRTPVVDVEFSPDSRQLVSISKDGETALWDLASKTSRPVPSIPRDLPAGESYLRFTREARPMLLAGCVMQGSVIDPATLATVAEWGDRKRLYPDSLIYAGGRRVVMYETVVEAGKPEALFTVIGGRAPMLGAISPDGARWITNYKVAANDQLQVLDGSTGEVQCDLKAFTSSVQDVAWAGPDRVLTLIDGGTYGGSLMLWDVSGAGKLLAKIDLEGVSKLAVSEDGTTAAVAVRDSKVALIAIGPRALKAERTLDAAIWTFDEANWSISSDGGRLLAGAASDVRWRFVVFDSRGGSALLVEKRGFEDSLPELSPDGRWAAIGRADGSISLFPIGSADAQSENASLTQVFDKPLEHPVAPGMPEGLRDLYRPFESGRVEVSRAGDAFVVYRFAPPLDEHRISVAIRKDGGRHLPIWETTSTRPFAASLPTWALLNDGAIVVEGQWVGADLRPRFFSGRIDPATGQFHLQRQSRTAQFTAMKLSPDGAVMAVTASEWTVANNQRKRLPPKLMLLDVKTGEIVRTLAEELSEGTRCRIVFSESGKRLAVLENGTLRVFETESGDEIPLAGEWDSSEFWFLDDGKILARRESGGSIVGVDLETQAEAFRWNPADGQNGQVTAVDYSLDGKIAAVGGSTGDLTLRDSRTGAVVHRLKPFDLPIAGLGLSPDGSVLAAADEQRRLIAWKVGSAVAKPAD